MALKAQSLIVYSLEVTTLNSSIDFKNVSGGSEIQASLNIGYYSVSGLANEISRALNAADPGNIYSASVSRNIMGGTQNRITIATNGAFLSLLFASGSRSATTVASLAGFNVSDYTGATSYTNSQTCGVSILPSFIGYQYSDDIRSSKVFGSVNVSASGLKESVVFNIQKFIYVRFKYEFASNLLSWQSFWYWAIQQRPFDFTPEITNPDTVYQVTLDRTDFDGKGLGFQMNEMLPEFPDRYDTGLIVMRVVDSSAELI